MGEIFISYSTKDSRVAEQLYTSLKDQGFTCWFAPNDVPPGGDYASRITQAINQFRYILVIVSQNSCTSEHVQSEVALAAQNKKVIIPFRIDDYLSDWMRYYISRVSWIEADPTNMDTSIETLIQKIKGMDNLSESPVHSHYGKSKQEVKSLKGSSTQIYQIQKQEIDRVQHLFLPDPTFEMGKALLGEQRLLILHSHQHTGKYTTALSILNELGVQALAQIFPAITETELLKVTYEENTGYLIDNITPDTLKSLNSFSLKKLSEHLQSLGSYLVITTSEQPEHQEYSIQHRKPLNTYQLLENHFTFYNKTKKTTEDFENLMKESQIIDSIGNDFLPRDAETLAHKLIEVLTGQQTIEQFLHSLKQNVEQRIRHWFEKERTIEQYALITALAVFNEYPYSQLEVIVDELKKCLRVELQSNKEEEQAQVLDLSLSLSHQLEAVGAERYDGFSNSNIGKVKDTYIRFKTKEDANAVLRYVWHYYPRLRTALLVWFELLLENSNKQINMRITKALASLFQDDTLFIMNHILQDWAKHKEPYYRVLAINLLNELAEYKENLVVVDKLLHHWASLSNNDRLQWTAAAAYGTNLGVYLFPDSFTNLAAIYHMNGNRLGDVVLDSISSLFLYGQHDPFYYQAVPYLFDIWLKEAPPEKNEKHQFYDLFFAILTYIDVDSLKVLLSEKEIGVDILPSMLKEGLSHWKTREFASLIIKHIFQEAHKDSSLQEPLRLFTFSLLVKGGSALKETILTILKEILQEPYREAAVPIVTEIIKLERKKLK
ncbi:toll/interleukin-1 receptor domain-containing protein [Neobacillus niacini]|uniref:toll/interleukin-1 receptor domain-containing protein n=1 Tax=Neobacillus niacini TaxID=86668 RepID=UPI0021CB02B1|nr:toll/interleukin-1 receptor domain-containing protein [Neobacillus niacini]MCM3763750.1 toll/interleukin-1 receptor domain-containing protein [Neobacillus niacini]